MNNIIKEFKEFAIKGNAFDLAIAVVIGASFTNIVNSLVNDIINPVVSLITGQIDLSNMFVVFSTKHFNTIAEAKAAGVATLNYGLFITNVINFLIVSFVIFIIVKQLNRFRKHEEAKEKAKNAGL